MQDLVLDWFKERKDAKISCFNKRLSSFSTDEMHVMLRDTSRYPSYKVDSENKFKKMKRSIEIVQIGVVDKMKRKGICTAFIHFLVKTAKELEYWDMIMIESVMSKELQNLLDTKFKGVFISDCDSDMNLVPNYYCIF